MKDSHVRAVTSFHRRCARSTCHVAMRATRQFHVKTTTPEERLGVIPIVQSCHRRLSGWAGAVLRMPMGRLPRQMLTAWIPRPRAVGSGRNWGQRRPKSKRPRCQHEKINGHRPPSAFRRKEQSKPTHVAPNHQTGIIPPHLTSTHTFHLKPSARTASKPGKRTHEWNSCTV